MRSDSMMNQSSWILDLVIKDAQIKDAICDQNSQIWFVVSADGLLQPFSTHKVQFSRNPEWNYPARLVLKFQDISKAYMYVTLCTFGVEESVVALARSRVSLRSLPHNSPKSFKFPLMKANNSQCEGAIIRLVATLSSFTPQVHIQPYSSMPPMSPYGGMNGPSQYTSMQMPSHMASPYYRT